MKFAKGTGFIFVWLLILGGSAVAQTGSMLEESQYWPTDVEEPFLGSAYGTKQWTRGAPTVLGPDTQSLTKTGLWAYPEQEDTIYDRYEGFFGPMDSFLNPFVPNEGMFVARSKSHAAERDYVEEEFSPSAGVYLDSGLPLTRRFNPDRAHLKIGQLYGDLLSVSTTLLHTDLDAATPGIRNDGAGDGLTAILSLTARGLIRLTEHTYFSITGTLYYLPAEGEVGFFFYDAFNNDLNIRFAYDREIGDWEFLAFNEFRSYYGLNDLYSDIETDEVTRRGRYRFGRIEPLENRSVDYFDGDNFYFVNNAGISAYWDEATDWRLFTSAWRRDVWQTSDFERHRETYFGTFILTYDRQDWRFVPFFQYYARAENDFDIWRHVFWLGIRGPVTQNTTLSARIGFTLADGVAANINSALSNPSNLGGLTFPGFQSNPFLFGEGSLEGLFSTRNPPRSLGVTPSSSDKFLWEIGLENELTALTTHSLFGGTVLAEDVTTDEYLATYIRYSIDHTFNARARARAFVQFANIENTDFARGLEGDLISLAGTWSQAVGSYGNLSLRASYDDIDYDRFPDLKRGIYRAQYSQRLMSRLIASLAFQYSDYNYLNSALDFHEVATWLTLTRTF